MAANREALYTFYCRNEPKRPKPISCLDLVHQVRTELPRLFGDQGEGSDSDSEDGGASSAQQPRWAEDGPSGGEAPYAQRNSWQLPDPNSPGCRELWAMIRDNPWPPPGKAIPTWRDARRYADGLVTPRVRSGFGKYVAPLRHAFRAEGFEVNDSQLVEVIARGLDAVELAWKSPEAAMELMKNREAILGHYI